MTITPDAAIRAAEAFSRAFTVAAMVSPRGSTVVVQREDLGVALAALRAVAQKAAYDAANPLGGPAKMFYAMAERIEAGEPYDQVLRDYGVTVADHRTERRAYFNPQDSGHGPI